MMNVLIRRAKNSDLKEILTLFDQLTISDLPYDREIIIDWGHTQKGKKYFTERISNKDFVCFIAESNNVVVGYATAAIKEVPSYRLIKVAELENLVVDKDVRNMGIGKKLLTSVVLWTKHINAKKLAVTVFTKNKKGVGFYRREGFQSYESTFEMKL